MENDDLIQRLEAMEKGEQEGSAPTSTELFENKGESNVVDVNHRNGIEAANEMDSGLSDEKIEQPKPEERMEVDDTKKKNDVSSSEGVTAEKTTNGDTAESSNSTKRRLSDDEEAVEPSSKKIHVDEEPSQAKPEEKIELNSEEKEKVDEPEKSTIVEEMVVEQKQSAATVEMVSETPEFDKEQPNSKEPTPAVDDKPDQDEPSSKDKPSNSDHEKTEVPTKKLDSSDTHEVENEKNENTSSTELTQEAHSSTTHPPEPETNSDEDKLLESDSKSTESDDVEPSTVSKSVEAIVDEEKLLSEEPQTSEHEPKQNILAEKEVVEMKTDEVDEKSKNTATEVEQQMQTEKDVQGAPAVVEKEKESEDVLAVESTTSKPEHDVPKPTETDVTSLEQPTDLPPQNNTQSKPEPPPDTEPETKSKTSPVEDQPSSSLPVPAAKNEDTISSSSEPKEVAVPSTSDSTEKSLEPDTVTSSDERPTVQSDAVAPVQSDSRPTAPVTAEAVEFVEVMEVDAEANEEHAKAEVAEPQCEKKQAYECTNEEKEIVTKSMPEPQSASTSTTKPTPEPSTEEEVMEVDSVPVEPSQSKTSDGDVTESLSTSTEEMVENLAKLDDTATDADSQSEVTATTSAHNKNLDSTDGPEVQASKVEPSKTLDDSIECTLPSSSSDKLANRLKQRLDLISNGSSTPNAAVSSSNVYNSTPIQKQFEVSSEDVSKITRHSVDNSRQDETQEHSAIVADNSTMDEKDTTVASTSGVTGSSEMEKELAETSKEMTSTDKTESNLKATESSEVDSCTASSGLSTAEEINLYASNARKFNGISSTSELDEKVGTAPVNITAIDTATTTSSTTSKLDLSTALTSEETMYEVNIWFDGTELQFLSVEKMEQNLLPSRKVGATSTQDLTGTDSSKQSSNGSVGSLGPFSLPPPRPVVDLAMSHSSTTESSSETVPLKDALIKNKHSVRGAKGLASLMIEEFEKIKRALSNEDEASDNEQDKSTTMKTPRGRPSSAAKKTASGRKRTHTESEEEEPKPKQPASKQAKKSTQKELSTTPEPVKENTEHYLCCLARWSDRKYYAGKVTAYKGDNKYMVLFEDGASKALSKDVIVIGDKDTLPILNHSVHALTGGDTYEPGFVTEIKRNDDNEVVYSVALGEKSVEVTASDMYLNEEQAKAINKACKAIEVPDELLQSPQSGGKRGGSASNTPALLHTPEEPSAASEKGSRSTRSKRGGADKSQTPATPEAGYSGGVAKKGGRRGRSKAQKTTTLQTSAISESSDVSDTLEEVEIPAPPSPESGLESVDGVQPELQRTEKESEIRRMYLVAEYLGNGNDQALEELLGPMPGSKTLFRNKHFLLTCTIPPKGICNNVDKDPMRNKYHRFSMAPFVKEHLRQQIEAGGGKVYQHFEDIPKNKYKFCKLIAPHPSATAKYVQCLAVDIPAVSHEWIIDCCLKFTLLDFKPYALPSGWSIVEGRYMRWSCGRAADQRSGANPFAGCCIQIASLNKDFTEFWSRVCKLAGATARLIKCETDLTANLTGYMLTDQDFPEDIKLRATRYGLLIVSTVWVVQSLIVGQICAPDSHEKLTQIYQDDDY
ncbi:mucin-2-like isoform X2 [Wyeomyia smithii]|nr:mucin-2-like isoform X2 [Wyeomyia smithii]